MSPNLIGSVALHKEGERKRDLSLHVHAPKKGHGVGGGHREKVHLQARVITQNLIIQHLNLERPSPRTVRNTFQLFKPPSLWHVVMAAPAANRVQLWSQWALVPRMGVALSHTLSLTHLVSVSQYPSSMAKGRPTSSTMASLSLQPHGKEFFFPEFFLPPWSFVS